MSATKYKALGLLFLAGVSVAAIDSLIACGPPPAAEDPATPPTPKPADKTEVTMQVTDLDAAAAPTAPTTSSSSSTTTPVADGSDDPNIGGKQDNPVIEKAVAPTRSRLRACYKKEISADPNMTGGSATFDATITKDGKVSGARFVKKTALSEDMMSCLLPIIKSMTFEGTQKSQIVTLSFGKAPSSTPSTATANDAGPPKK